MEDHTCFIFLPDKLCFMRVQFVAYGTIIFAMVAAKESRGGAAYIQPAPSLQFHAESKQRSSGLLINSRAGSRVPHN